MECAHLSVTLPCVYVTLLLLTSRIFRLIKDGIEEMSWISFTASRSSTRVELSARPSTLRSALWDKFRLRSCCRTSMPWKLEEKNHVRYFSGMTSCDADELWCWRVVMLTSCDADELWCWRVVMMTSCDADDKLWWWQVSPWMLKCHQLHTSLQDEADNNVNNKNCDGDK